MTNTLDTLMEEAMRIPRGHGFDRGRVLCAQRDGAIYQKFERIIGRELTDREWDLVRSVYASLTINSK